MKAGVSVVLMTAPDPDAAERLGRTLVEEGRAACANVLPGVTSIYRWRGAVERAEETLVMLKTSTDGVAALIERAAALHPYEVPEVLSLAVESGHSPYLAWVREEIEAEGGS